MNRVEYETWKTASGKEILIKDMTDLHLVNTILMLITQQHKRYEHGCAHANDSVTIASIEDVMPAPGFHWFEHSKLNTFLTVAKARGIKVVWK